MRFAGWKTRDGAARQRKATEHPDHDAPVDDAHDHSGYETAAQDSLMDPGMSASMEAGAVLDAFPDNIAVLDGSGTIVAVNEAWQRFARDNGGSVTATGPGVNYLQVCREAAQDAVALQVANGLQAIVAGTQMCLLLEYPCHSPTQQHWFLLRAMPGAPERPGAIVFHTEITARKLATESAKAAERLAMERAQELEAVLAAIPDGLVVFDQHGLVVQANKLDQDLAGDVRHEPVEQRAQHLNLCDAAGATLAEERIPAIRILHGEVLSSEHPAEVYATAPDGRRLALSVTGSPIRDASGRSPGGVMIYRDVTSERQSAQRYRALLEMAPDATLVADGDGRIQLVNHMTEQMFGYSRDQLIGQLVEQIIPERFHTVHVRHRAEYSASPRTRPMGANLRLFGRKRDGSEFPVEVSLASLEEGGHLQVIVSIRDVSKVQRVQAANEELRQLLELTDTALAQLELDTLLPTLLRRVYEVMQTDCAAVLLMAANGQELRLRAIYGMEQEVVASAPPVPLGQGLVGWVAASHAPLIVDDVSSMPKVNPSLFERVTSAVGVPLLIGERIVGVLHVETVNPRQFSERDVQLLERVADRMAVAIQRAQMFEAEQEARQAAEAALARAEVSERHFKRLVESGIIGMVVDDTRYVLDANDAYLGLLGYTREEMQSGKLTREALSPDKDMLATSERAVREALEKGHCLPFEREYVRKDGSRVPVFMGVALLDREPPLFVSFLVDLTERNRALAALRASEERLRLLVENAPAAIALFDREMRYLSASHRWLQDYGLEGDLVGRSHYDIFPEIPAHWKAVHRRCLAGAVERCDEDQFERSDGTIQWLKWEVRPWYNGSAEIGGIVIFAEDVTQQRHLEREREEATSRELAASAVALQMDQFFAVAAHDIRNPVAVVSAFMQLAHRRASQLEDAVQGQDGAAAKLSDQLLAALQAAEAATQRLTRMTELLFDVARARAGSFSVVPAPCDAATVVREQVASLRLSAPARRIYLRVDGREPVEVIADADRIGQVVANFVTNALKYSPNDQPVHVRVQRRKGDVRVSVRDHGPGLPPEEQVRVWKVFHRAPGVNVQSDLGLQSGSLGLGLHICRRIVELHPGGHVGIDSLVGRGSTFWFQLPLASEAAVDA